MYEDAHVIEYEPGLVKFKYNPELTVTLETYLANKEATLQRMRINTRAMKRALISRIRAVVRQRGWKIDTSQAGLRALSWALINADRRKLAVDMPRGIATNPVEFYHWYHLVNATALCASGVIEVDFRPAESGMVTSPYITEDEFELLEAREKLLTALDTQLDGIKFLPEEDSQATAPDVQALKAKIKELEDEINKLRGSVSVPVSGRKEGSVRPRKGRTSRRD